MLSCVKADQRRHSTLQAVFRTHTGDILCVLIVHLPAGITAVGIEPQGGHIAVKDSIPPFSLNEDTAFVCHNKETFSSYKQTVIAVYDDTLVHINEVSDLRLDLVDTVLIDVLACHIFVIDEGGADILRHAVHSFQTVQAVAERIETGHNILILFQCLDVPQNIEHLGIHQSSVAVIFDLYVNMGVTERTHQTFI